MRKFQNKIAIAAICLMSISPVYAESEIFSLKTFGRPTLGSTGFCTLGRSAKSIKKFDQQQRSRRTINFWCKQNEAAIGQKYRQLFKDHPVSYIVSFKGKSDIGVFRPTAKFSKEAEVAALELLKKELPFTTPPTDLPYLRGILIRFSSSRMTVALASTSVAPVFSHEWSEQREELQRVMDIHRLAVEERNREQRAEQDRRHDADAYARELGRRLVNSWKSISRKGSLSANYFLILDSGGRITEYKLLNSSGQKAEDVFIGNFLSNFKFFPLPDSLDKIELHIKFVSEGSMKLVDVSALQKSISTFPRRDPNEDLDVYMRELQNRIMWTWFPPKGYESKRVVVTFDIDKFGAFSDLKVKETSGSAVADDAAFAAVSKAAPFRPLPGWAPAKIKMEYTFDYYSSPGGGRASFADN